MPVQRAASETASELGGPDLTAAICAAMVVAMAAVIVGLLRNVPRYAGHPA